jgi:hypothetical protein
MTKVNAVTCPACEYTVFSRTRHDSRSCFCGQVSIDGGFAYTRLLWAPEIHVPKIEEKVIPQTPMELYDDWNEGKNLFGLIPPVFEIPEENDG